MGDIFSKGAQQTGSAQGSTVNPLLQAQAPFLHGIWESGQNLYNATGGVQPYPGQTYAVPDDRQYQGLNALGLAGGNAPNVYNNVAQPFIAGTTGGYDVRNGPAFQALNSLAYGTTGDQQAARNQAATLNQYGQQSIGTGTDAYGRQIATGAGAQQSGAATQAGLNATGADAAAAGGFAGSNLYNLSNQAVNSGNYYGGRLADTGDLAGGYGLGLGGLLTGQAAGIPGTVAPYQGQLVNNAATAVSGSPVNDLLGRQARGEFLNSNPYLDAAFNSATNGISRQFQTAVSPRTASQAALAGRSNSGYFNNAQKQTELNLGDTLKNYAGDIYDRNYRAERGLMDQAGATIGQQYSTNLGLSNQAATSGGQLGLTAQELQQRGLTAAGQVGLQGLQQRGANLASAANAASTGYGQGIQGYNAAGTQTQEGLRNAIAAQTAGGQIAQQGYGTDVNAVNSGANQALAGLQNAGTMANQAGTLGLQNAAGQNLAAGQLQSGFQAGNQAAIQAAGLAPTLQNLLYGGANAQQQAGTGYQTLEQANIADQIARYNAQQQQPWQALRDLSGLFGQPVGGGQSSNVTSPIYGSPLAQGIGNIGGIANLLGGGSSGGGLGGIGNALGLSGTGASAGFLGSQGPLFGTLADASIAAGGPPLAAGLATTAGLEGLPLAAAAAPFTIICTELVKQDRMPNKWRLAGMRQFMCYPEVARRGYWVWARPVVSHLRKRPDSKFSRFIEKTFNWRAEDLAARNGIKGARRLLRGRLVTAAMVIPCLACGLVARRGCTFTTKDAPA